MPDNSLMRYDTGYFPVDISASGLIVPGRVGVQVEPGPPPPWKSAPAEIYLVNWLLVAAAAVVANWVSDLDTPTSATILGGAINGGTFGAAPSEAIMLGHVKTIAGEGLHLNLGAAVNVTGYVVVAYVPTDKNL